MSVEILTISLSDESIDRHADAVSDRLSTGSVGNSSPKSQRRGAPKKQQEEADPWADDDDDEEPPASGAAPARRGSSPRSERKSIKTKNGVQNWQLNPDGGPDCDCGDPAAIVKGTANGKRWGPAYRCAKGAGSDWKEKCDFNEWL